MVTLMNLGFQWISLDIGLLIQDNIQDIKKTKGAFDLSTVPFINVIFYKCWKFCVGPKKKFLRMTQKNSRYKMFFEIFKNFLNEKKGEVNDLRSSLLGLTKFYKISKSFSGCSLARAGALKMFKLFLWESVSFCGERA